MDPFKLLIAKNNPEEKAWLPLYVHLLDAYNITKYLLDSWISDAGLHALTGEYSMEEIKKTACFLAIIHDYGKASLTFQSKIAVGNDELINILSAGGFEIAQLDSSELYDYINMPHGIAGEILLHLHHCPASLSAIVGAHHGRPWDIGPDIKDDLDEMIDDGGMIEVYRNFSYGLRLWGNKKHRNTWIKSQDDVLSWAMQSAGIKDISALPDLNDTEAVIISGLIVMADWLASNEDYFPLIPYEQSYPDDLLNRWKNAVSKINLPPTWKPERTSDFIGLTKKRFGFCPNTVQTELMKAVVESNDPGLFILEAPMGIGKTEAALLASEAFSKERVSGLLFALPTQATANGIFSRVLEWGKDQTDQNSLSIRLAHGMAMLNEQYVDLMDKGKYLDCVTDDYEDNRLIVHDFFQGSKQALLADFVVGTVDQVLLASLQQKFFMLRHLGLSGKTVIIDECHAYDAYMNEYLERTLQWLGKYQTPVIMLSATLPYERRSALIEAYQGKTKSNDSEAWRKSIGYPLLTWTDGENVNQKEIAYSGDIRKVDIVKLETSEDLQEQIIVISQILLERLQFGGCAGIVVNTVTRAQLMADGLRNLLPDKKILLLHSRFLTEDRSESEKLLLKFTGKKSTKEDRDDVVIIGTQVIEQSLDFDVDFMISDLCPMDLLLQRIGRLHRHPAHNKCRPDQLKNPQCFIIGGRETLNSGGIAVYGEYLLMRTRHFLPDKLFLPTDIAPLVQKVYDDNYELSPEPKDYQKARMEAINKKRVLKKDADAFRLCSPGKAKTINHLLAHKIITDDEHAKAQVRNGERSLEVLIMFSRNHVLTRAPWRYKDHLSTEVCPDAALCRSIANQKVRIPSWILNYISLDELKLPKAWEDSVWLKKQHLLILNQENFCELENIKFKYSNLRGLDVERREM